MLLATSTQVAVGWVIAVLVGIGFVAYLIANLRAAKPELGSEIELAANRKPYFDDMELETSRLDRSLVFALSMLAIVAVALPVYWLAEPARITNAQEGFTIRSEKRGAALYVANCERCHGPGATGGVYATSITDDAGAFVANVSWKAPALTAVLTRFSEEEVTDVLNYGRNGVMPAWGAPGGGPLTTNNLRDLIIYLRTVQLPEDKMRESVDGGIREGAKTVMLAERPALQAALDAANRIGDAKAKATAVDAANKDIETALDAYLKEISDPASPFFASVYGKLVFNNSAAQGAYSCARCHTKGWSYSATQVTNTAGVALEAKYSDGNGWFGPSLQGGSTTRKFNTAATHEVFITGGSEKGKKYGNAGVGDGQMPGFGARIDDTAKVTYPAILTDTEIKAVVAYERGMQ
jgi:mono/diheme cytochrome c family protein